MKRNRFSLSRFALLLIVIAAVSAVPLSLLMARYIKRTEEVKNTFAPAVSVIPPIEETFEDNVKENVYFTVDTPENQTQYPVYFRAAIVVTWKDQDKTVYFSKPREGIHYSLTLNENDWKQLDGDDEFYYYWDSAKDLPISVPSGEATSALIEKCELLAMDEKVPEGYTLSVEIIVETVQAVGTTDQTEIDAWRDAWNIPEKTPEDTTSEDTTSEDTTSEDTTTP